MPDPVNEIEEFLRRLRAQAMGPDDDDDEIIDAEIVETVEPQTVPAADITDGQTVADHVAHHLDPSGMTRRGSRLGRQVDLADERMESHLQDVFEHRLGDLGTKTSKAAESILDDDTAAARHAPHAIIAMLRSPQSLRQLIVLREVIDRPEHLW